MSLLVSGSAMPSSTLPPNMSSCPRTFQAGDKNGYGEVEPAEFDEMVECAAEAPRKYGLAPATDKLYKNNNDRMMHRIAEFSKVDYHSQGFITFNEWLKYVLGHIRQKVRGL